MKLDREKFLQKLRPHISQDCIDVLDGEDVAAAFEAEEDWMRDAESSLEENIPFEIAASYSASGNPIILDLDDCIDLDASAFVVLQYLLDCTELYRDDLDKPTAWIVFLARKLLKLKGKL